MCITEVYLSLRDRDRRDAKSDETNLASIPLENNSWVDMLMMKQKTSNRDKDLFGISGASSFQKSFSH